MLHICFQYISKYISITADFEQLIVCWAAALHLEFLYDHRKKRFTCNI